MASIDLRFQNPWQSGSIIDKIIRDFVWEGATKGEEVT